MVSLILKMDGFIGSRDGTFEHYSPEIYSRAQYL